MGRANQHNGELHAKPTLAAHAAQYQCPDRQPQIPVNFSIQSTTTILLRSISCLSRYIFE